jgi:NAD(P)-dependent dehydrogenase (short-subunit alcohol dehydrogenase family)
VKLHGKVAIITGGASGIGRAISLGFAAEGARIVIADLNADTAAGVVAEVAELGSEARFVRTDVSSLEDHQRLLEQTIETFGRVDVLINDAAYSAREKVLDVTPESWDRHLNTDLRGLFFLSQLVARRFIEQGSGGRIINVASVAGQQSFRPVSIAYHAAKAGVIHITKVMGTDLAEHGITVNCIGPGTTLTPMSASQSPEYRQYLLKGNPTGRLAEPEEMVPPAVMFASDEGRYITGQTIFVDGGSSAVYLGRGQFES